MTLNDEDGWSVSGDEWQTYCEQLFVLHHPNSYARMPDEHKGDLGVEGYSIDGSGCAYQCYATEAETPGKRAEAQMRKMRRDLKKMRDNRAKVKEHLGDVLIRRWVLVVPKHDSIDVTACAREQEETMRNAGLDFLASDFRIDVQTPETHFIVEQRQLEEVGAGLVRSELVAVQPEELEQLADHAPELLANLDAKIRRLIPNGSVAQRGELRDFFQTKAVQAANLQDALRVQHAPIYERYLRALQSEENDVQLESMTGASGEQTYVADVRRRFEQRLRDEVKALGPDEASALSHGALADWLRRCPIDFPSEASSHGA